MLEGGGGRGGGGWETGGKYLIIPPVIHRTQNKLKKPYHRSYSLLPVILGHSFLPFFGPYLLLIYFIRVHNFLVIHFCSLVTVLPWVKQGSLANARILFTIFCMISWDSIL